MSIPWFNNFGDNEPAAPGVAFHHLLSHLSSVTSLESLSSIKRSQSQQSLSARSDDAPAPPPVLPDRDSDRGHVGGRGPAERQRERLLQRQQERSVMVGSRTLPAKLGYGMCDNVSTKTV